MTQNVGKILQVCTFFSAVKFGRMSKKQREKVEDEVRYHKEINNQSSGSSGLLTGGSQTGGGGSGTSPDSSVFDTPQPSSTAEHLYGNGGG